ncbi:hypothetical protein G5714_024572 [Onychostoma macrolepis]|uniref:Uncharacterized protein n=1 Tax=Onychostoma macrolepis TaxID=369639 RepID=A0A7J6BJ00_9TELE|nr:hypothetical protein G5714_024572 [Onychostoma macrolepis]
MNAWPPQASYPCGNFSDTSCLKPKSQKDREAPLSRTPALLLDRCTAQSNSPPATVPGQVAPGTTWAPGLTQKREPAGARLLPHRRIPWSAPVLSRLLGAAEAPLEAARLGTPPPGGGESTETEVPTRAVAGRSARRARRRPESPPHRGRTPAAPPDAGAADTPDTPARRHPRTSEPLPPREGGHRHGREGGGKRRERGRRGPGAARRRRNGGALGGRLPAAARPSPAAPQPDRPSP